MTKNKILDFDNAPDEFYDPKPSEGVQAPLSTGEQVNVSLICAKNIDPEPIDWIWEGYLAKGKLHIIAGKPASGKTTIAIELAAIISRGGNFPDGSISPDGHILFWSTEDSISDVLIPRLMAAGANMERIHFVDKFSQNDISRPFDPSKDMLELEKSAKRVGKASLLVLDPIVTAVKGDSHNNSDTRKGLQPIVDFAHQSGCAVLGVTHFTKGTAGGDPLERITGSLAFGALTRMALIAAKPDEIGEENNKRILTRAKSSFGPDGDGFYYVIENQSLADGKITTGKITWLGEAKGSAKHLLSLTETPPLMKKTAIHDAIEFLREALNDGPIEANEIFARSEINEISRPTLNRAKDKLGVESKRLNGSDKWYWVMPDINKF